MAYNIGRRNPKESYPGARLAQGDHKVLVNAGDTTAGYLDEKLIAGANITLTPVDLGGGDLALSIAATVPPGSSDHKVLVDGADTTAEFLLAKLAAGAAIALAVLSPGGNEQVEIAVSDLRNAQVASDAAIAGTKIDPNFGSQNVSTTGTLSAGSTTVSALTVSGLGLGVVHSSGGGVLSSSLIVNADVSASAAIAGTKIDPNFGSQNISTTGTIDTGAATVTALTVSSLLTGVVHSTGGVFSSSLIVNADVSASAAIAGTKISPDFGAQNIVTTGSITGTDGDFVNVTATVAEFVGVTVTGLGLGVVHSSAGGVFSSSTIVNADVNAAAAIAGTKISPDFGSQNVTTTGALILGATVSTTGDQRWKHSYTVAGRNSTNATDVNLIRWGTPTNNILRIGDATNLGTLELAVTTTIGFLFTGSAAFKHSYTTAQYNNAAGTIAFDQAVTNPLLGQTIDNNANVTGDTFQIFAQTVAGSGTIVGGALIVTAGDTAASGGATNGTGGKATVRGGDAVNASATNIGGDLFLREGHGSGTGAADGNIAMHAEPGTGYQSMQRGIYIGNAAVVPSGNPNQGYFLYVEAGALKGRGSGGTVTTIGAA